MADLDPALQAELTEYLAHKNRQQRASRKYGPWLLLVFIVLFGGFIWWQHTTSERAIQQMNDDYNRDVEKMHRDHQQRVDEMRRDREQFLQGR
jgi:cytoskeletal protein RodZ